MANHRYVKSIVAILLCLMIVASAGPLLGQWNNNSERKDYLDRVKKKWSLQGDDNGQAATLNEALLAQSFMIPAGADIDVRGRGGTKVYIPYTAIRNRPAGRLKVVLYEVLEPMDYYLAGVDLSFGNQILESGGMAKYEVYNSVGQKVRLNARKVRLEIPRVDNKSYGSFIHKNGRWIQKSKTTGALKLPGLRKGPLPNMTGPGSLFSVAWLMPVAQAAAADEEFPGSVPPPEGLMFGNSQDECPDNECEQVAMQLFDGAEAFTWLNFDKPLPQVACMQARIQGGDVAQGFSMQFVGTNRRTVTSTWSKSSNVSLNAIQKTTGVLIVEGSGGLMGIKKLTVPTVDGYTKGGRTVSGRCSGIGTVTLVSVPKDVRKNKDKLKRFLGL